MFDFDVSTFKWQLLKEHILYSGGRHCLNLLGSWIEKHPALPWKQKRKRRKGNARE